jgi:threonyl-tRNA synthetase
MSSSQAAFPAIAPAAPAAPVAASDQRYIEVAQRMQLIHLAESAGVVYWQPAGLRLYEKLRSFVRAVHVQHGYQEVKTPSLVGLPVFEKSGHLGKYRENMFLANQKNDMGKAPDLGEYALRPMSCPNHIELFKSARRSYRELPLAYFEFGEVFRNEPSGSLQVLFRQRQFCQDDSHVFVAKSQVVEGVKNYLDMSLRAYRDLGFEKVELSISLRPEQRFGEDVLWDQAEESLREACREAGLRWREEAGGGAFYGPKLELGVRDKLGRLWQMGVVQLDYVLPNRFGLSYIGEDGAQHEPVLLHHAVLGSLERMVGTLLESFGADLPAFLHPYPLVLLPVSQKHLAHVQEVAREHRRAGRECVVEASDEPLGAKVRKWKIRGALSIEVFGDKEVAAAAQQAKAPDKSA